AEAKSGGAVQILVREKTTAPELATAPVRFGDNGFDADLDLSALAWRTTQDDQPHHAPGIAAQLRIRIVPAAKQRFVIRNAALLHSPGYVPLDLGGPVQVLDPGQAPGANGLTLY